VLQIWPTRSQWLWIMPVCWSRFRKISRDRNALQPVQPRSLGAGQASTDVTGYQYDGSGVSPVLISQAEVADGVAAPKPENGKDTGWEARHQEPSRSLLFIPRITVRASASWKFGLAGQLSSDEIAF
jgi:hypothetical protein